MWKITLNKKMKKHLLHNISEVSTLMELRNNLQDAISLKKKFLKDYTHILRDKAERESEIEGIIYSIKILDIKLAVACEIHHIQTMARHNYKKRSEESRKKILGRVKKEMAMEEVA